SDLTSCGCQGFCHRLCPDRRTVDDVEVHVSVQEGARRRSTHDLPFGYFLMARGGWGVNRPRLRPRRCGWGRRCGGRGRSPVPGPGGDCPAGSTPPGATHTAPGRCGPVPG